METDSLVDLVKTLEIIGLGALGLTSAYISYMVIRRHKLVEELKKASVNDPNQLVTKIFDLEGLYVHPPSHELLDTDKSLSRWIPFVNEIINMPKHIYRMAKYVATGNKPNFINVIVDGGINGYTTINLHFDYDDGPLRRSYQVQSKSRRLLEQSLRESITFIESKGYRIGLTI